MERRRTGRIDARWRHADREERKHEAAEGVSEVERQFAKRTFLARPERLAAVVCRPSVFRRADRDGEPTCPTPFH